MSRAANCFVIGIYLPVNKSTPLFQFFITFSWRCRIQNDRNFPNFLRMYWKHSELKKTAELNVTVCDCRIGAASTRTRTRPFWVLQSNWMDMGADGASWTFRFNFGVCLKGNHSTPQYHQRLLLWTSSQSELPKICQRREPHGRVSP